jgi:hypothetical protein
MGPSNHRGDHSAQPQGSDESGGLPVNMGDAATRPSAEQRPAMSAGHLGGDSRFIDEVEVLGIKVKLAIEPGLPPPQDIGTALVVRLRQFL